MVLVVGLLYLASHIVLCFRFSANANPAKFPPRYTRTIEFDAKAKFSDLQEKGGLQEKDERLRKKLDTDRVDTLVEREKRKFLKAHAVSVFAMNS